jgi:hypothetical protein
MLRSLILVALLLNQITNSHAQNKLGAIGEWREQYNNKSVQHLIKGDKVYGATTHQLFSIDNKNNIEWLGKSTGLNEIGIAAMAWDELEQQLVIAYNNSNIDIISGDNIYNINDIVLSNLYPNKKINDIKILNQWAFISTNFGIVVLDLKKHEIKDTWFPNNNRQAITTYQTAITKDSLYAVTEEGVYSAAIKNNWVAINSWNHLITYQNLGIKKISSNKNQVALYNNNSVFQLPSIQPIFNAANSYIKHLIIDKDGGILFFTNKSGSGNLLKLNADKSTTVLIDSTILGNPLEIVVDENNFWIADSTNGLLFKNSTNQWIKLAGPSEYIKGKSSINDKVLLAPFHGNANGFSVFEKSIWKNYTSINSSKLPICIASAIDPKDQSWWFTTPSGLLHYNSNTATIESSTPSNLNGTYTDLQYSPNGNLWVLQDNQGLLQKKDNVWKLFAPPNNFMKSGLNKMIINKQGQAWIIAPKNQGLYIYQSTEKYPTELWKQLTTAKSNGNLPSSNVTCVTEDRNGSIWVGTDNGIGIFNCGDISKEICDASIPRVSNTNKFVGQLFQKEIVNCITVDGANRKWVGTNNGAWLLSSDGLELIEHFTKDNSPLPSDTLLQIMIDPSEGEVFFNTNTEIVSYRGNATNGGMVQNDIAIYPNPVGPEYNGPIAFKGLVENAIVKITELNGRLVFETRALGGQAIWNGKTYEGKKVASGIYLVFVRDDLGNEKAVGKVLITSGL